MRLPAVILGLWALTGADEPRLREASGVLRHGTELWVVGDDHPGTVFVAPARPGGRRWTLVPDTYRVVQWPAARHGRDLESLEVLGDGQVVVLSEQAAALYGSEGLRVVYGESLAERDGAGLEGLAVKSPGPARSRVAVLWEGDAERPPRVLVHDLDHRTPTTAPVAVEEADGRVCDLVLPASLAKAGDVRAPDLVWDPPTGGADGFLVLLQGKDKEAGERTSYLQRFDAAGRPRGALLALAERVPSELAHANWEGLDWFTEGRQLVLVHDRPPKDAPVAVVVDLPEGW